MIRIIALFHPNSSPDKVALEKRGPISIPLMVIVTTPDNVFAFTRHLLPTELRHFLTALTPQNSKLKEPSTQMVLIASNGPLFKPKFRTGLPGSRLCVEP